MEVRQKWPARRGLSHGLTRRVAISGSSRITEMKARKNAVCTLSTCSDSARIITPLVVKMKPPLTSHSAPCTLGGRRRSQLLTRFSAPSDFTLLADPIRFSQCLLQKLADVAERLAGVAGDVF